MYVPAARLCIAENPRKIYLQSAVMNQKNL